MNSITFILAWKYLLGTRQEKSISTMVIICFLGIFIGSFALALVASIMNGFEKVTHEKMQSIHPQIILNAHGQLLDVKKIGNILKNEFPAIESFSPNTIKQVIIQEDEDNEFSIAMLKGISPTKEHLVNNIEKKIVSSLTSHKTLEDILTNQRVLIGEKLANILEAKAGDKIRLFFSPDENIKIKKIQLEQKDVIIGGTFKTGIDEFDTGLIIGSLKLIKTLFPESGPTQMSIKLKPGSNESETVKALRKRFNMEAYSWKELYPALVEALKLEKYAMFFILALITLVASMNIISLLFMQITQKRGDIAILKTMGLPNKKISHIFLYIGMTISIIASSIGLIFAFIVGLILERYPFISLPDAYYVTHLPSQMEWSIFVTVFGVVLFLAFLATWIPTRKLRSINISQVLKFEG